MVLARLPSVRRQHRVPCAYSVRGSWRGWTWSWRGYGLTLTQACFFSPPSDTTEIRGVEFACRRAHCAPGADRGGGPRAVNSPGSERSIGRRGWVDVDPLIPIPIHHLPAAGLVFARTIREVVCDRCSWGSELFFFTDALLPVVGFTDPFYHHRGSTG